MMRLQRVGRKNDPSYRVVVVDKRTGPKSNKNIDVLGSYSPKLDHIQIDADKAKVWLSKGVQPSDTVHNILVGQKVIDAKKINVLPKKTPVVSKEEAPEQKEETESQTAVGDESSEETSTDTKEEDVTADTPSESTDEALAKDAETKDAEEDQKDTVADGETAKEVEVEKKEANEEEKKG